MGSNSKEASYSDDLLEFWKIYFYETCSQQLRLTPAFVEKFKGNLVSERTKIEGPDGRCFPVIVREVEGGFFFMDGWSKFVQDYSLQNWDFLTFAFTGSKFYVKIFGKNCSKKKTVPTYRDIKGKQKLHSDPIVVSNKSDHDRVYPHFEATMTRFYVNNCVNVTLDFSQSYVKDYLEKVERCKYAILQVRDKSWKVSIAKCGKRYQLSNGWPAFAKDNLLEEGDLCKFELVERSRFVLKVTITKSF